MYLNIYSLFTLSVSVLLKEDMSMTPIKIFFLHFVKSPVLSKEPILLIFFNLKIGPGFVQMNCIYENVLSQFDWNWMLTVRQFWPFDQCILDNLYDFLTFTAGSDWSDQLRYQTTWSTTLWYRCEDLMKYLEFRQWSRSQHCL